MGRYLIALCILLLVTHSSFAQELEVPRLGTFQVKKNSIPEMQDVWKRANYSSVQYSLKLPSVTTENYRMPIDMANVVTKIEKQKQAGISQDLINNIRLSYGTYQKEEKKASLRLNSSFQSDVNSRAQFGTCIHGYSERYCSICSPRNRYGSFGRPSFYQNSTHPIMRGQFYYP